MSLLSAASSVLSLITGGAPVTLGDFEFRSYEVPERISYGGEQRLNVHKLPGPTGQRVIDVMGPDEAPIAWSGTMLGVDASQRRRALNLVRWTGDPVDLTWGDVSLAVVVESCTFEESFHRVDYRISCTIKPHPPGDEGDASGSLLDNIGDALGIDIAGGLSEVSGLLTQAQQAAQVVGAFIPGAAGQAITGALGKASVFTQAAVGVANGNVGAIGAVVPGTMGAAVSAAGRLASGAAASGFIGSALKAVGA